MNILSDPPVREPFDVTVQRSRWLQWFYEITKRLNATTNLLKTVALTAQSAAVTTANVPLGTLVAGQYRLSYYARISTVAGVSSSLTVTVGWTDGVAQTFVGAAMTGNTTTTYQRDEFMVTIDKATNITYALAYASNPAAAMQYKFTMAVEAIS